MNITLISHDFINIKNKCIIYDLTVIESYIIDRSDNFQKN